MILILSPALDRIQADFFAVPALRRLAQYAFIFCALDLLAALKSGFALTAADFLTPVGIGALAFLRAAQMAFIRFE